MKRERSHRGIYILPNIFTSLNLFCGFYSLIASINGKFVSAATAIIIKHHKEAKLKVFDAGKMDEHEVVNP